MRGVVVLAILLAGCSEPSKTPMLDGIIEGDTIPSPLNDAAGDAARGERVFSDRNAGHCVLCHAVGGLDSEFQGTVGPDLSAVAARLSPGQIRLRIVDISRLHPDTVMPSYYRTENLSQVAAPFAGQPVLTSQDIEDLIAYLSEQAE